MERRVVAGADHDVNGARCTHPGVEVYMDGLARHQVVVVDDDDVRHSPRRLRQRGAHRVTGAKLIGARNPNASATAGQNTAGSLLSVVAASHAPPPARRVSHPASASVLPAPAGAETTRAETSVASSKRWSRRRRAW